MSLAKLGPHVILPTEPALAWSRVAPIVKALDRTAPLQAAHPDALRIFRRYWPETEQDRILDGCDAAAVVGGLLERLGGYRHPRLYVELLNEVNRSRLSQYVALHRTVVPQLHAVGLKVAGFSWSTGAYEAADWDTMRAAGFCGIDLLSLHSYWGNEGFTVWHALRWRNWWRPGDPPVVLTEVGRDRVEGGQGGWRKDGVSEDTFLAELEAYDREIARDAHVVGATVFSAGPTPDWEAFSTDPLSPRLAALSAGWGPIVVPLPVPPTPVPIPTPEVPMLLGVDVSNHQGRIDWRAVAGSGRRFAFMKASEDPAYVDQWFAGPLGNNWSGAKAAGLIRGAYHFARPSVSSPAASVTLFENRIKAAGGLQAGDLVALDIEDEKVAPDRNLRQWCAEWLDLAERVFGVRPVIYSGYWYMQPHGLLVPSLGKYPLWYASYQDTAPPVPAGWDKIAFWQFTAHGRVPGITGDADANRFLGTEAELRALGKAGTAPVLDYESAVWGPIYRASQELYGTQDAGDAEDAGAALAVLTRNKKRHGA